MRLRKLLPPMIMLLLQMSASAVTEFHNSDGKPSHVAAIAAGFGLLYFGARLGRERSLARARALLLASVLYLPALLGVMVVDRRIF